MSYSKQNKNTCPRAGRGSFKFPSHPDILGFAAVVGKKESEGPLGNLFDLTFSDNLIGEDSWEKAESRLQQEAVNLCISKSGLNSHDFDAIFSGDLLNQCIASTFGLRSSVIPHVGMYGACSTMASTLINAAVMTESRCATRCVAVTSSHFSSSERQFRNPLQYGGQRTPTAQWTVTGSGAVAVGVYSPDIPDSSGSMLHDALKNKRDELARHDPSGKGFTSAPTPPKHRLYINAATIGIIEDLGITDANNMGAAMAPAAASTIRRFFENHKKSAADFDLIMTGDLGFVGSELMLDLLLRDGIDISDIHNDGGKMIFDRERQDVHAGGSGCGCSASVLCADVLPRMVRGELDRLLFVGTGALMSPTSSLQGESIPSVAHAVEILRMK